MCWDMAFLKIKKEIGLFFWKKEHLTEIIFLKKHLPQKRKNCIKGIALIFKELKKNGVHIIV
jgi:hypothetical protein